MRIIRFVRHKHHFQRFRRAVLAGPAYPVATDGPAAVHVLVGRRTTLAAIAAVKSLLRFTDPLPLVVHEDGTLDTSDRELLVRHFPGVRLIGRTQSDDEVGGALRRLGFERCAALRDRHVFALKLFDLRHYSIGRAALYLDTDVLFHRRPDEMLAALAMPPDHWVDRFNQDFASMYAWPEETIRVHTGVALPPRFNAGLLCLRRERQEWELLEHCLQLPPSGERAYFVEQTLNALDCARHGAVPLPDEYDVSFRHVWRGHDYLAWAEYARGAHDVVSQHYCNGTYRRLHFHRHFVRRIAPTLATPGSRLARDAGARGGQSARDSSSPSLATTRLMSSGS